MRPDEKRHDDNRQSATTGVAIFAVIIVFLFCAIGSALFSAYHRDTIDAALTFWNSLHPVEPPKPQPQPLRRTQRLPPGKRPLVLTAALANPKVTFVEANFSRAENFATTDFCALLQKPLPELSLKWDVNPLFPDTSNCAGNLQTAAGGDDAEHNSFFVQTTRNALSASTMVRLKLVYLPESTEASYRRDFERAAKVLFDYLLPDRAGALSADVEKLRPFDVRLRDIQIKLFEEKLMPGAFNLTIEPICGKDRCPTTRASYKLNQPAATASGAAPAPSQQE
ncbi:DUF6030 family protein [Rhizobium sp. C1]|uniref:DUF6030 family protein n=1 Tax=Rhizobium sp. C1 TaxID=1349799 RepID=UPI001E629598|nr:DUF6030 family protein [Rhizobium sp. C1]MCD2178043.1 DUF6030 family protein [Rhizobium sp. C1]